VPHHVASKAGEAPHTEGKVIGWARWYDLATWLMTFGREPAIRRRTIELAAIREGESALDVGCGTGTLTLAAKRRAGAAQVRGIDASAEMIEVARRKATKRGADVEFQVALVEDLPFPDGSFDVVLSSLMLHHRPDDLKRKGFAEILRVLKLGGRLFAVDLAGSKGVAGAIMRLVGHRFEAGYMERLKGMAQEAGFDEAETGPLNGHRLGYLRAVKAASKEAPDV
jgi:demethylmenaquinone methyltransferase/2-methoxy-6-polyprenyl-1,4-benzoquinol methylase/phosphoethanolamine N-methyltransferase